MLVKELKITNASGDSITFGRHFCLDEDIDLSALAAEVIQSESSDDGASYQRTRLGVRDFNLSFFIDRKVESTSWIEEKRQEAYRVFNPKRNPMRLDIVTAAANEYYLNAELVATPTFATDEQNSNIRWQNGLLQFSASDPYLYEKEYTLVEIATWMPSLQFPLVIPEEGIMFGYRTPSLIANVFNGGQDDTGMIIKFKANASLSTPSLINVNTYEEFKLNMELDGGDVVEVSTYKGKKYARLTKNNVTTSVFGKVDLSSTFLQLAPGDNLFRYDALNGIDNLEVSMYYKNRLVGV